MEEIDIIGPFLGPVSPTEINILIALPKESGINNLECTVCTDNGISFIVSAEPTETLFRVFKFNFANLPLNMKFRYKFHSNGKSLDLQGGLTEDDCIFFTREEIQKDSSFILLSCNNPFASNNIVAGWGMWDRLLSVVTESNSVGLILLAGDQVYCDEVEIKYSKLVTEVLDKQELRNQLVQMFINQYIKFWGNLSLRKVLARVPSLAMWDDHDITDGWGGRTEFYEEEGNALAKIWCDYFEVAQEAFRNYQSSRNPNTGNFGTTVETSFFDWGKSRFYLLDFRSEKNSKNKQLWSKDHERQFFKSLLEIPDAITDVYMVFPVVPFRSDPKDEEVVAEVSLCLYNARKEGKKKLNDDNCRWYKKLYYKFAIALADWKGIGDLTDDLEDSLTSLVNIDTFKRIMKELWDLKRRNKEVVILSGDIHTAGMSEFLYYEESQLIMSIPQIVSSPIAYEPMERKIEGGTSSVREVPLNVEGKVTARNIAYFPDRNFARVFIQESEKQRLWFYLESHNVPVKFHLDFT